jgi:hypothetical protein
MNFIFFLIIFSVALSITAYLADKVFRDLKLCSEDEDLIKALSGPEHKHPRSKWLTNWQNMTEQEKIAYLEEKKESVNLLEMGRLEIGSIDENLVKSIDQSLVQFKKTAALRRPLLINIGFGIFFGLAFLAENIYLNSLSLTSFIEKDFSAITNFFPGALFLLLAAIASLAYYVIVCIWASEITDHSVRGLDNHLRNWVIWGCCVLGLVLISGFTYLVVVLVDTNNDIRMQQNLVRVSAAQEAYRIDNGNYTTQVSQLKNLIPEIESKFETKIEVTGKGVNSFYTVQTNDADSDSFNNGYTIQGNQNGLVAACSSDKSFCDNGQWGLNTVADNTDIDIQSSVSYPINSNGSSVNQLTIQQNPIFKNFCPKNVSPTSVENPFTPGNPKAKPPEGCPVLQEENNQP